jgi:dimethylamine/trimethylamine dehydrogenase
VRLSADDVRDYGAELVVVATGSAWARDGLNPATRGPLPGADAELPHVLTPEQIMLEGKRPPGERVVVYDSEGYYAAPGVAELLRGEGRAVTLVTACEKVAPACDETLEGSLLRQHLHDLGIAMLAGYVAEEVSAAGVRGHDAYGDPFEIAAEAVVLCTQRCSEEGLFLALDADPGPIEGVYRIGDCVAPTLIADAIFSGHRLAREIDSPDPSRPLPFRRERPGLPAAQPA